MSAVFSACALAFAGVLWVFAPVVLAFVGLDAFGELGPVVLVILGLTAAEALWARFAVSGGSGA